jgi:DNA-binding response OmpR family regulator
VRDEFKAMRILLLNLCSESTQAVQQALSDQGYDIAAEQSLTVDEVLARTPELLITEATPSNLSCCGLISQIKASSHLQALKIVMIVHGDALERARGLDLGADDVVSFPLESLEFAAKIRTQIRERQPELALESRLKDALKKEHLAEITVEALSGSTNAKRRFWVLMALFSFSAETLLASLVTVVSSRPSRKDTLQLNADIARLNDGLLRQGELLPRADQARDSLNVSTAERTRESLKVQTEETRKKMAADGDTNDESLKSQLEKTQNRLDRLENEDRIAETIVHTYGPSVCFLHVVVGFRDKNSGQLIRIAADSTGQARVDDKGMVSLDTDGTGPPLQLDFFGTGFLVASDGRLLTNHHVAVSVLPRSSCLTRRTSLGPLKASWPSSTGFRSMPIWQLSSYRLPHRLTPHSWCSMTGVKPVCRAIRWS